MSNQAREKEYLLQVPNSSGCTWEWEESLLGQHDDVLTRYEDWMFAHIIVKEVTEVTSQEESEGEDEDVQALAVETDVELERAYNEVEREADQESPENYGNEGSTQALRNPDSSDNVTTGAGKSVYQCDTCMKNLKTKAGLLAHRKVHNRKSVQCRVCVKKFRWMSTLKKHCLSVHSIDPARKHKCTKCQSSFSTEYHLQKHYLESHSLIPCTKCKKNFDDRLKFKTHKISECVNEEMECTLCKTLFCHPNKLRKHMIWHSLALKFKCSKCKKTFKTKDALQKHLKIHSEKRERDFSCAVCSASFFTNFHLKRHELTHSSVKSHVCQTCAKTFSRPDKLREHARRYHSVVSNHSCDVCSKRFTTASNLKRHLHTHQPMPMLKTVQVVCEKLSIVGMTPGMIIDATMEVTSRLPPSVCFQVEKIIGISTGTGNTRNYHVQWAPTWISGFHLVGCEDLIASFLNDMKEKDEQDNILTGNVCTNSYNEATLSNGIESDFVNNTGNTEYSDSSLLRANNATPRNTSEENLDGTQACRSPVTQRENIGVASLTGDRADADEIQQETNYAVIKIEDDEDDANSTIRENVALHGQQVITDTQEPHSTYSVPSGYSSDNHMTDYGELNNEQNVMLGEGSSLGGTSIMVFNEPDICKLDIQNSTSFSTQPQYNFQHAPPWGFDGGTALKSSKPLLISRHKKFHGKPHWTPASERPFKCHYCPKSFSQKNNLQTHIKLHIGGKPVCKVCNKTFSQASSLWRHMKLHKRDKVNVGSGNVNDGNAL